MWGKQNRWASVPEKVEDRVSQEQRTQEQAGCVGCHPKEQVAFTQGLRQALSVVGKEELFRVRKLKDP